jgi:hypothetical protein
MTAAQFYAKHLTSIQVPKSAIVSAKTDRGEVARAALQLLESWGLAGRLWYPTGALAMGTQIHPLNDFDLVIEANRIRAGWAERPRAVLEDLCEGLAQRLGIPSEPTAHAVKLDFGAYTADVVFGLSQDGSDILLPHCPDDEPHKWIESDPRKHAQLVRDRNDEIGYEFAREIRILKSLNRRWGMQAPDERKPVSSWHLTALGLTVLCQSFDHAEGTPFFFSEAARLVRNPLADPSGAGADLEARDPRRAAQLFEHAAVVTRDAVEAGDRGNELLEGLFGDAAALRAAVGGAPVSVGAAGAFTVGVGREVHTAVRGHGDVG